MTIVPSGGPNVMQRRDSLLDIIDDFPTPPWATRALCEHVLRPRELLRSRQKAWDPACNRGYMVRPLREYFDEVVGTDVMDYSSLPGGDAQSFVADFLPILSCRTGEPTKSVDPVVQFARLKQFDFIITNPPFSLADQFILRALNLAGTGVAMFVRTSFLESEDRYWSIFKLTPPTIIAQFVQRVPILQGRCHKFVIDPKTGKRKTASTATSYAWLVWVHTRLPEPMQWIKPCRAKLERDTDYLEPPR